MYGREHGDEHDSSWAVQGAIEWLRGDDARARSLRRRVTLLAMPIYDPDAVAASRYESVLDYYKEDSDFDPPRIALEYARFFSRWLNDGHRLDLTLNVHNVESDEAPHLHCQVVPSFRPFREYAMAVYAHVAADVNDAGFKARVAANRPRAFHYRLHGFLQFAARATGSLYEVNSQASERHLTLSETRRLAAIILRSAGNYVAGSRGRAVRRYAEKYQLFRMRKQLFFNPELRLDRYRNAIETEHVLNRIPDPVAEYGRTKRYRMMEAALSERGLPLTIPVPPISREGDE